MRECLSIRLSKLDQVAGPDPMELRIADGQK